MNYRRFFASAFLSLASAVSTTLAAAPPGVTRDIFKTPPAPFIRQAGEAAPYFHRATRSIYRVQPALDELICSGLALGTADQLPNRTQLRVAIPHRNPVTIRVREFLPKRGFTLDANGTVRLDPQSRPEETSFYWYGAGDQAELSLYANDGRVYATLTLSGRTYALEPQGSSHVLRIVDDRELAASRKDFVHAPPGTPGRPRPHAKSADIVDVLFVYTAKSYSILPSDDRPADLRNRISLWLDQMNTALVNSGAYTVHIRNVMPEGVSAIQIDYDENPSESDPVVRYSSHLNWLQNSQAVRNLRDQYRADVVSMIVFDDEAACGLAFEQYRELQGVAFENYAYSVSGVFCSTVFSVAHEIGHNLGMSHDPANGALPDQVVQPWAYGHFVSTPQVAASTIMSYPNECSSGCPHQLQYSNPDIDFEAFPGVPSGTREPDPLGRMRFNALTASKLAAEVASFRGQSYRQRVFRSSFEPLQDSTGP